jgi:hypothetical protein
MTKGITNIIIGKPLVDWWELCCVQNPSGDEIMFEKDFTLFTNERVPAKILKELGVVKSISEIRRNKPELCETLNKIDCFWLKWGKNRFWVVVGEE